MATSTSAPANADVTAEDTEIGEEYDRARAERVEADDTEKLDDDRVIKGGVVVTGAEVLGTTTLYPGAEKVSEPGAAVREAKGLPTDDVTLEDTTWTAQSAKPYVASNAEDVPGQTFTVDELPDPRVMAASGLPAHTIPAALVVDAAPTDSIHPGQERGADLGTSNKRDEDGQTVKAKPAAERKVSGRGDSPTDAAK